MQQQEQSLESLHARLGVHAERLSLAAPATGRVIAAARLLDPDTLVRILSEAAAYRRTSNLRPVASQWHKHYSAALLLPVLSAMTIADAGIDGAIGNVSIVLDPTGMPTSTILHSQDVTTPASRRSVIEGVLQNHLAPLIDQLRTVTGLPRRILWANAANVIADLYDKLDRQPEAARAAAGDRRILLDSPVDLVTGGPNPMYDLVHYEPICVLDLPPMLRARQVCCQRWLLPEDKPCASCPRRSLDDRITAALKKKRKREAFKA